MNGDFREDLKRACEVMQKGGVILYPTDTIWGIGCDATNPAPQYISKILSGKVNFSFKSIAELEQKLNIKLLDVLELA